MLCATLCECSRSHLPWCRISCHSEHTHTEKNNGINEFPAFAACVRFLMLAVRSSSRTTSGFISLNHRFDGTFSFVYFHQFAAKYSLVRASNKYPADFWSQIKTYEGAVRRRSVGGKKDEMPSQTHTHTHKLVWNTCERIARELKTVCRPNRRETGDTPVRADTLAHILSLGWLSTRVQATIN